jgi:hypothetical protein
MTTREWSSSEPKGDAHARNDERDVCLDCDDSTEVVEVVLGMALYVILGDD